MANREHWSSRLGFILAAAGSAIGLGNLWKFPYITYENGGGSFVLVYLVCVALIGLPIMVAETLLGRRAGTSVVGAFRVLAPHARYCQIIGWLGVAAGFVILSYYSVVAGWTLEYAVRASSGYFDGMDAQQVSASFGSFLADPVRQVGWHAVFMLLTMGVVMGGVKRGIERWARILMPVLLALIVALMVYSLVTGDAISAFRFVFRLSPVSKHGVLEAMGHAFFTLSLGMGAMATYGSYVSKDVGLARISLAVTAMDTAIALGACMVLYPMIYAHGLRIEESVGIIFTTLPSIFARIPLGGVVAPVFFLLMAFAALTSTISLLEVVVAFGVDELGLRRRTAALSATLIIFLFGVPSALCNGAVGWLARVRLLAKGAHELNWFDSFDYLATNWMLPLGGLLISVFIGWVLPAAAREEEFRLGARCGPRLPFVLWDIAIRYVSPAAVLVVLVYKVGLFG